MRLLRDIGLFKAAPRSSRVAGSAPSQALRPVDAREECLAALLTDIDGTLIDTNALHAAAWCDAFRAHGIAAQPDVVAPMIGMGGDKIVGLVARGLRSDEGLGKVIVAEHKRRFLDGYLRYAVPTPGARALLKALREAGVRIVAASSARGDEREALLRKADVIDLVEPPPDEREPSKPDPDIIRTALDQAGVGAGRACMLGDTPYDVDAAAKAGIPCVAVRCGGWDDEGLDGAVAIYDDPADILRHLDDWALPTRARSAAS